MIILSITLILIAISAISGYYIGKCTRNKEIENYWNKDNKDQCCKDGTCPL